MGEAGGVKFRYLSSKSIEAVKAWYELNADTPLGEAWLYACCATSADTYRIADQAAGRWAENSPCDKPLWKRSRRLAGSASDFAFQSRDSIGRIILEVIKRNAAH